MISWRLAILLLVSACTGPDARAPQASRADSSLAAPATTSPLVTPDSVLLARFQAFLDSSVVTRRDSSAEFPIPGDRCEDDQIVPAVAYLLAAGQVLAVTRRTPESATVRAVLTSVGEDSLSAAGVRRVQVAVRTDTVNWDMVSDSVGGWYPCGYASTERGLGHMGTRQYPATWVPAGSGWADVARLADSVRRARGLAR